MLLKSLFISLFITALTVALGHAGWMLWQQPQALEWWAVVLATAPSLAFFVWVFSTPVARTSSVMWLPLALTVAGALVLILSGSHSPLPWIYALGVGLAGNLLYQLWYSRFGRKPSAALRVGAKLPPLEFEDEHGQAVQTSQFKGPLLLMFYRGNWCPLCMAQIREVAAQYNTLAARGVNTLLISSQSHANTASLAHKFKVDFRFLVDNDNQVARALGIVAKNGTPTGLQALGYDSDTAMPTVVLTDADQTIIFCDETDNYRVRPEPQTFLRLLDDATTA